MREKKFCVMVTEEDCEVSHKFWVNIPIGDLAIEYKYGSELYSLRAALESYADKWNRELDRNSVLLAENDRLKQENMRLTSKLGEIDKIITPF